MFRLRRPTHEQLDALLRRLRDASFTYPEVGATLDTELPAGYAHDRYTTELDGDAFQRASDGLRAWRAHLGAGVGVYPVDAPLRPGTVVIVMARTGPLHALAPCRVVHVIDEPDRFGFAYGTLPGHPERGEEAFIVERAGRTTFSIVAFSCPADVLARIGDPVARAVQRRVTGAYLEAMRRYTAPRH